MASYYSLGHNKRLCDIIIAGSHDAGITSGDGNAQTQNVGIKKQAEYGVRIFDLRIIAAKNGNDEQGNKQVQFRAYHADGMLLSHAKKPRTVAALNGKHMLTRTKLKGGVLGETLVDMLQGAKDFISDNGTEFLLLKFDKCKNWDYIALYCQNFLGDMLYTAGGDINTKSLFELKGKIVCLFSESGLLEVADKTGILSWRSLKGSKTAFYKKNIPDKSYSENYNGLQYYGKGGTDPFAGGSFQKKLKQNTKKQKKMLHKMADNGMDYGSWVMGMMYWTSTGLFQSIKDRDDHMWKEPGKAQLLGLFEDGLGSSIEGRFERNHLHGTSYSSGSILRTYMPNIVMIDFASLDKCDFIYGLNTTANTMLTDAFKKYVTG